MPRTTVALDPPILEELREIALREDKPLRKVIGELLIAGIRMRKTGKREKVPRLKWHSQPMEARIDYTDKDELYKVLDERK